MSLSEYTRYEQYKKQNQKKVNNGIQKYRYKLMQRVHYIYGYQSPVTSQRTSQVSLRYTHFRI